MTAERYKAELAALAREACDACGGEYLVAEMFRCSHCDFIYCLTCFHPELDVCWKHDCLYSAANRLRELRDAAINLLEALASRESARPGTLWTLSNYDGIRVALEILRGEKTFLKP